MYMWRLSLLNDREGLQIPGFWSSDEIEDSTHNIIPSIINSLDLGSADPEILIVEWKRGSDFDASLSMISDWDYPDLNITTQD